MKEKTKERLLFLLGVAICFAVAALSVLLEKLIPGGLLGGDLSQGSLREGAPRSGGGDCVNNVLALFTAEPSNLFVHALSLTLVPRELLYVCLQTRQSLCDMPAGSLLFL